MKKIKAALYGISSMVLSAPVVALAQFGKNPSQTETYAATAVTGSGMTDLSFYEILTNVMNWLIAMLGIGAIISFVIAGIMYLTAAGDETKTEKAKNIMTYAIIAIVVALIGFIVLRLVAGLVGDSAGIGTTV